MMVQAVNRVLGQVLTDDNALLPVARWLDSDGEYCGPVDAVVCVAGPTDAGQWVVVDLRQMIEVRAH